MAKSDFLYESDKAKSYQNDPDCLADFYRYLATHAPSEPQHHGILKSERVERAEVKPTQVTIRENCEPETESTVVVMASWFQEQMTAFFEENRGVILLPTDSEHIQIGNEFTIIDDHLLDTKPVRVASEQRNEFKPNKNLLEIFNWYSLKYLQTRSNVDFDSL